MGAALTICHKTCVLVVLALIVCSRAWAQDLSALAGTWILDPNTNDGRHLLAGVAVVGPNPSTLAIDVSASRVILYKGSTILNREGYRLDGSETDVGGERRGTAAIENGNLVLTIRRTRLDAGTSVFKEIYSASGKLLAIERQLRVIQADGTVRANPVVQADDRLQEDDGVALSDDPHESLFTPPPAPPSTRSGILVGTPARACPL